MVTVKHKENGSWVDDGEMTEEQANQFVLRCEYDTHNIEYKIEPIRKQKAKKEEELNLEQNEISD